MYYIYLIELMIASLAIVVGINYLMYIMVTEWDKLTYVKGYNEEKRRVPTIVKWIYEILVYIIIFSYLPALIYYFSTTKAGKKRLKVLFQLGFVTPLVGIFVPYIIYLILENVMMAHDFYGISNVIYYWYNIWLWISIPFFIILLIRQWIKFMFVDNQSLYSYAMKNHFEYDEEKIRKKNQAWKRFRKDKELAEKYFKIYENVDEWKQDKFNIVNYQIFFKVIIVFSSPLIIIVNILIATFYFDILDMPYAPSPTNYEIMTNVFSGDQYIYFYTYFSMISFVLIASILLTYVFNSNIVGRKYSIDYNLYVLYGKSRRKNKILSSMYVKGAIQLIIITVTIVGIVLVAQDYPYDNNKFYSELSDNGLRSIERYPSDVFISFDKNKELVVEAVKTKYDYASYSREEKYGYVMIHYKDFIDDLEELGLTYDEDGSYSMETNIYWEYYGSKFYTVDFIVMRVDFTEEYRTFFPEFESSVYIFLSDTGFWLSSYGFDDNSTVYNWDYEYYKIYDDEKYFTHDGEKFTPIEVAVEELMIETTYEFMDKLFAMEMEDRGIEI